VPPLVKIPGSAAGCIVFIELEEQPIECGAQIVYTVGFRNNDLIPQIEQFTLENKRISIDQETQ